MKVGDKKEHKEVNSKTGEVTITTSIVTQEEIDQINLENQRLQTEFIHKRLNEIDKEVSEARVFFDMIDNKYPHQRILDLKAEYESLIAQLNG